MKVKRGRAKQYWSKIKWLSRYTTMSTLHPVRVQVKVGLKANSFVKPAFVVNEPKLEVPATASSCSRAASG